MLNEQLQKQIEQEAKNYANLETGDWSKIQGPDKLEKWELAYDVYKDGAEKYAEKWQEAQQLVERYEKALKEIQAKAKRGIFPHLPVEVMGAQMCIEIDQYVTDLLTPKTGSDE